MVFNTTTGAQRMKFCKDCKWVTDLGGTVRHPDPQLACGNERVGSLIDIVDGRRIYIDCHVARGVKSTGGTRSDLVCGKEGLLWEPHVDMPKGTVEKDCVMKKGAA
jgi:hypothetical protein